ncbi:hypothetical protein CHL33_26145 [Salmonella enterica]|nr:hypothetical protein [Salmonella enterica]
MRSMTAPVPVREVARSENGNGQKTENGRIRMDYMRLNGKRHIRTVFYFCPRFLPWTLSRTWTLPWTKIRLITEDPGSSLR